MRFILKILVLFSRLKLYLRKFNLAILPDDLVLDVGSGNDPHPRADVLFDLSLDDNAERVGPLQKDDRPLILGDAAYLPFKDKAFDYIICTHVLEHIADPDKCLRELMRVGRKGYIETPSEFSQKLVDLPCHRWFVRHEAGRLVFIKKRTALFDEQLASTFFELWERKDPFYLVWCLNHEHSLVRYHWEEVIKYEIKNVPDHGFQKEFSVQDTCPEFNHPYQPENPIKAKLKKLIRYLYAFRSRKFSNT